MDVLWASFISNARHFSACVILGSKLKLDYLKCENMKEELNECSRCIDHREEPNEYRQTIGYSTLTLIEYCIYFAEELICNKDVQLELRCNTSAEIKAIITLSLERVDQT